MLDSLISLTIKVTGSLFFRCALLNAICYVITITITTTGVQTPHPQS